MADSNNESDSIKSTAFEDFARLITPDDVSFYEKIQPTIYIPPLFRTIADDFSTAQKDRDIERMIGMLAGLSLFVQNNLLPNIVRTIRNLDPKTSDQKT